MLRTSWPVKVLVRVRGVKRAEVDCNSVLVAKELEVSAKAVSERLDKETVLPEGIERSFVFESKERVWLSESCTRSIISFTVVFSSSVPAAL